MDDQNKKPEESGSDKTVQEVIDSMNEEQKTVMYALVGQALDDAGESADDNKEGDEEEMKHNVFDKEECSRQMYLAIPMRKLLLNLRNRAMLVA